MADSIEVIWLLLWRLFLFFGILGCVIKFIYTGSISFSKAPFVPSLEKKKYPILFWIWIIVLIYLAFFCLVHMNEAGRGGSMSMGSIGEVSYIISKLMPKWLFSWLLGH